MTGTRQLHDIGRRRAYAIWGAGLAVYVLAVFHRTSLGVAGLLAADRFDINASQLATFTVLQLAVYAAMQVPVGVALDRFGSRALIISGLVCMTIGQLWFAVADSFAMGLGARALVGAGDAMVFTAVLRLVAVWFLVRQAPVITQITGMIGQMGAVAAARARSRATSSSPSICCGSRRSSSATAPPSTGRPRTTSDSSPCRASRCSPPRP